MTIIDRPTTSLSPDITLRAAVPADVPELLRLVHALATYEREPDAVEATEESFQQALFPVDTSPSAFAEVAESEGRLVGMALWFVTFSTWTGRGGIWLEDLFVEPELRGRRVGHELLARLARICVARQYPRLEWRVLRWNTPSIDFYVGHGAQACDEWLHHRVSGGDLDRLAGPGQGSSTLTS